MDKLIDEPNSDEFTEWMYPKIEIEEKNNELARAKLEADAINEQKAIEKKMANDMEIEALKVELREKIALVNSMVKKLDGNLDFVDKDFIDLIHNIIKKMVKNIISKEIKSDPKIINKIISDLKELIHEKNGMVTVFLSERDSKRFNKDETKDLLAVKVDPSLSEGDVIIKSNHTEIHSIISERLEKMIGTKK